LRNREEERGDDLSHLEKEGGRGTMTELGGRGRKGRGLRLGPFLREEYGMVVNCECKADCRLDMHRFSRPVRLET